ncbi:MAG: hypothetical protein ACRC0G_15560 [Fusobacteriaceae bacterium]
METSSEFFLRISNSEDKKKIKKWINEKAIEISDVTLPDLCNSISCLKQILNEEIKFCSGITKPEINKNLSSALITAKENKIDKLVDIFNNNNTHNKTQFSQENKITFSKITTIKKASLEIESFDYENPVEIQFVFNTNDGEVLVFDIIPYDYNGLYKELLVFEEFNKTKFKVANKENIYFYTCDCGEGYFVMGKEIKLQRKKDYDYDLDGRLVFTGGRLEGQNIIIMYQPNENAYEIELGKKLISVELIVKNDFVDFMKNKTKRLVVM